MTWSYTASSTMTGVNAVRWLVGNTSSGDPVVVSNEEIGFALTQTGNMWCAAVQVAESMLQQYGSKTAGSVQSKTVGNLSISYGDRVASLQSLLPNLRRQCALRSVRPIAGGITVASREERAADTSLTDPLFRIGMDDNLAAHALESSSS